MKNIIITTIIIFSTVLAASAQTNKSIEGIWENKTKKMKVEIYNVDNKYFGKVVWLSDNSNEEIRLGDVIIKDLEFEKSEDIYNDGTFVWGGNKLKCAIKPLEGERIKIMLSKLMYSREMYWTKTRI